MPTARWDATGAGLQSVPDKQRAHAAYALEVLMQRTLRDACKQGTPCSREVLQGAFRSVCKVVCEHQDDA